LIDEFHEHLPHRPIRGGLGVRTAPWDVASKSVERLSRELQFAVTRPASTEALEIVLVEGQSGDVLDPSRLRERADLEDRGPRPLEGHDVSKLVEIERCGCPDPDNAENSHLAAIDRTESARHRPPPLEFFEVAGTKLKSGGEKLLRVRQ
jgi:hypothetical protein